MHFSIPDTEEFSDSGGSMYMGYNIHINGTFHCTVRYRQLLSLHEQLRRELGPAAMLPPFPPKRFLPLSPGQLEERRGVLEKYIQTVSQDIKVSSSELFTGFLLSAQVETSKEHVTAVNLDVYLMNGQRIFVEVNSTAPSQHVLLSVCQKLELPPEMTSFFSLFLTQKDDHDNGDITVIKKLQDFESPYISLKCIEEPCRIVLRKSFWDVSLEAALLDDEVALDLLYSQAVAEVESGWVMADMETRDVLSKLQAQGDKHEYLELARGLKYYGFMQFKPCWCDYPRPGTRVCISAGNRELNFRVQLATPDGSSCSGSSDSVCSEVVREGSFRVTRMRCWRITTLHNGEQSAVLGGQGHGPGPCLELAFEYLMSKDRLQWVTVCSEQAILMSTCLQDMVAELLIKKNGGKIVNHNSSWSYMRRDGSSQKITKSVSSDALSDTSRSNDMPLIQSDLLQDTSRDTPTRRDHSSSTSSSIRRFSEKLSSVALKATSKASPSTPVPTNPFVENDAFEGIGDDDL